MSEILSIGNDILKINEDWLNVYDDLNPLNLPPFTIRVQTTDGEPPRPDQGPYWDSCVRVAGTTDQFDITKASTNWSHLITCAKNLKAILGANSTGVLDMAFAFNSWLTIGSGGRNLEYVAKFDTSTVTNACDMFLYQEKLTSIPAFNFTSLSGTQCGEGIFRSTGIRSIPELKFSDSISDVSYMFGYCRKVESGILRMYNNLKDRPRIGIQHEECFRYCGYNTVTGAAELAQIPSDWK